MTKKYDMFMEALQHLCEVHEITLFVNRDGTIRVEDIHDSYLPFDYFFGDFTKEPS